MAFPVKNFYSGMHDAPVINGTPGSLINALKACLITGFGELTARTASVDNGYLKLEFADGKTFRKDSVVEISGATPDSLNGEHWVEISQEGACYIKTQETSITGVIKVKYAPVGQWTVPYQATNKAAFKSVHPHASECLFQIDDTYAQKAKVVMYRTMTGIDQGEDYVPFNKQQDAEIIKSSTANTQGRLWYLFSDGKTVYFTISPTTNSIHFSIATCAPFFFHGFGSYITEGFATKLNAFVQAGKLSNLSSLWGNRVGNFVIDPASVVSSAEYFHTYIAYHPATNRRGGKVWHAPERFGGFQFRSGFGNSQYPKEGFNKPNNKIYLSDVVMITADTQDIIGRYPGFLWVNTDLRKEASGIVNTVVDGADNYDGRRLFAISSNHDLPISTTILGNTNDRSVAFIDITGPWG